MDARTSTGGTMTARAGAPPGESGIYTELQVTTNYSFLRGASHIEELLARAAVLGMKALVSPTGTPWRASCRRIGAPGRLESG